MHAYRDQYAQLFHDGRNIVLVAISVDPADTLAAWARDDEFPFLFASDTGGVIGKAYGAYNPKYGLNVRNLFVVGPDGRSRTAWRRSGRSIRSPTRSWGPRSTGSRRKRPRGSERTRGVVSGKRYCRPLTAHRSPFFGALPPRPGRIRLPCRPPSRSCPARRCTTSSVPER